MMDKASWHIPNSCNPGKLFNVRAGEVKMLEGLGFSEAIGNKSAATLSRSPVTIRRRDD
jgi:hypothetical protein